VKNLEIYYENHLNYNQNYIDFQTWLAETKQALRNVHDLSGTKDDVGGKLGKIMVSVIDYLLFYRKSIYEGTHGFGFGANCC
jgi:hypothetical protein